MPLTTKTDAAVAATMVRRQGISRGFPVRSAGEIAIVASELASNAIRHGGGGFLRLLAPLADEDDGPHAETLEVEVENSSAVIVDVDALLSGELGHTHLDEAGRLQPGLGQGIAAVMRLADEFHAAIAPSGRLVIRARVAACQAGVPVDPAHRSRRLVR